MESGHSATASDGHGFSRWVLQEGCWNSVVPAGILTLTDLSSWTGDFGSSEVKRD